jgi:hypothetical protein
VRRQNTVTGTGPILRSTLYPASNIVCLLRLLALITHIIQSYLSTYTMSPKPKVLIAGEWLLIWKLSS